MADRRVQKRRTMRRCGPLHWESWTIQWSSAAHAEQVHSWKGACRVSLMSSSAGAVKQRQVDRWTAYPYGFLCVTVEELDCEEPELGSWSERHLQTMAEPISMSPKGLNCIESRASGGDSIRRRFGAICSKPEHTWDSCFYAPSPRFWRVCARCERDASCGIAM